MKMSTSRPDNEQIMIKTHIRFPTYHLHIYTFLLGYKALIADATATVA